jgi:chromosome segregation ATPase
MAFLQNEKARLQAEVQAAGAQITSLTTQLQTGQQAAVAAQGRVIAAQARVADAQSKIPALEAAAASADQRAEAASQAVEEHSANEPDRVIEVDGRPPRPNPAWRTWNTQMNRLTQQLSGAQTEAGAAHGRLNDGRNQVSLAVAERQAAERQVTDANSAVAATEQAIAAARQRLDVVQARAATVDRWNDEIVRDPLVRPALEPVAAELSGRAAALDETFGIARVQREIAEETQASLIARRDQLTPALNQVNGQLPGASEELRVARLALTSVSRNIQNLRRRGPLP